MTAGTVLTGAPAHNTCDGCKRILCRGFKGQILLNPRVPSNLMGRLKGLSRLR